MRTSTLLVSAGAFAASSVAALRLPHPEAFDTSLFAARAIMPAVLPASLASSPGLALSRRAPGDRDVAGEWECGDDEEFVPYPDEPEQEQEQAPAPEPVFTPEAVTPIKAVDNGQPQAQEKQEQEAPAQPESTPPAAAAPAKVPSDYDPKKVEAAQAAPKQDADGKLVTPENIAEGTYTVEEGCSAYHTVVAGDYCLKVLEQYKELNTTLDELYCLNPAIDDKCYNLWIGTSYCVGYSGEAPLNTGV